MRDSETATLEQEQIADPQDHLLDCLEFVAGRLGIPFSRVGAVSSLPMTGPALSPELLPHAAARQGLLCDIRRVRLSRIPAASLPVIIMLKNGNSLVLSEPGGRGSCVIWTPERREMETRPMSGLKREYAGYAAFLSVSGEGEETGASRSPMHFARTLFSGWSTWLQILLTAFFVNILGLAVPLFTMNVYDRVIPNMSFPTLWALALGVLIALVMDAALRQLRAVLLDSTGRRIDLRVSSQIFEHAVALSLGAKSASSGTIASQIREFDAVREFFTSSSIIAITDLLFIGISLWVLWLIAGDIALVPLLAVPLVIAVTLLLQIPLSRTTRALQLHGSRRHAVLVESLAGLEAIKSANAEGHVRRKWDESLAGSSRANSSVRRWSSLALYFTSIIQQGVVILITVWGVTLIYEGRLTIGALIAANILSSRILSPLGNIAMTLSRGQQAISALAGINSLMKLPRDRAPKRGGSPRVITPDIEFRKVTFAYPGQEQPALNELSCKISSGERVGIVGKVGSGKTTMGRLMAGLYLPSSGAVLISQADTRSYDPAELRAGVGFVPQDPELFTGSLRENIIMGMHQASDTAVLSTLTEVGLMDLVKSHPAGLQMEVGERGRNLSGGQRQAVGLARILIRNPRILFLDEPSSALDSQSEQALIRSLLKWSEGGERTLVVCSHRLGMLNLASRLLVINEGRVTADGPRDEIIARLGGAGKAASG